jgi:hypothetical protein
LWWKVLVSDLAFRAEAAAAEDEDVEVRWIARYALRLAQRETSADV